MSGERTADRTRRRKHLSQNFLIDPAVARRIVRASGVTRHDLVVEIGPGDGIITRRLMGSARRVLAYEKDARYAERLRRRHDGDDRLDCRRADFLDAAAPRLPFVLVGNVPFGITTDVVRWALAARTLNSATLVTQLEFARKHTGDFGRWSRLTAAHWPQWAFEMGERIGRGRFRPVPRVDAAVLRLVRRPEPLLPERAMGEYRRMVDLGFSGVGGSLAASLRRAHRAREVDRAFGEAGLPRDLPVGLVSPEAWLRLFGELRWDNLRPSSATRFGGIDD